METVQIGGSLSSYDHVKLDLVLAAVTSVAFETCQTT